MIVHELDPSTKVMDLFNWGHKDFLDKIVFNMSVQHCKIMKPIYAIAWISLRLKNV